MNESAEGKVLALPMDVNLERCGMDCRHHLVTMGVGGGDWSLKRGSQHTEDSRAEPEGGGCCVPGPGDITCTEASSMLIVSRYMSQKISLLHKLVWIQCSGIC